MRGQDIGDVAEMLALAHPAQHRRSKAHPHRQRLDGGRHGGAGGEVFLPHAQAVDAVQPKAAWPLAQSAEAAELPGAIVVGARLWLHVALALLVAAVAMVAQLYHLTPDDGLLELNEPWIVEVEGPLGRSSARAPFSQSEKEGYTGGSWDIPRDARLPNHMLGGFMYSLITNQEKSHVLKLSLFCQSGETTSNH